jgi:hypothetical protein
MRQEDQGTRPRRDWFAQAAGGCLRVVAVIACLFCMGPLLYETRGPYLQDASDNPIS